MTPPIKPRDLVRTPSGRTARVVDVLPGRMRLVEDLASGDRLELHERLLYVVQASPVLPWRVLA